jgi:hypothetical protein
VLLRSIFAPENVISGHIALIFQHFVVAVPGHPGGARPEDFLVGGLRMRISGENFGPVLLQAKGGLMVEADRPIAYMKSWPLQRVIKLAARWRWQITLSDDERAQLNPPPAS